MATKNLGSGVPFGWGIALGNQPGVKSYIIAGRKDTVSAVVGQLDDVSQIPATVVIPNPGGAQLQLFSSSGSDTLAGSGIQQVSIHYLDTAGAEQTEIVDMAGAVAVPTAASDIDRIQWMHAEAVGAGGVAAGNILLESIGPVGTGTDYEMISLGGNQSLSCRYSVPAGKTGYVTSWGVSGMIKELDFRLRGTVDREGRMLLAGVFLFQAAVVVDDGIDNQIFDVPLKFPALSQIKVSANGSTTGGDAGAWFEIVLIDNV